MEDDPGEGEAAARERDDDAEYYLLPEEALQYLPEEWRSKFEKLAEDGRAVLQSVDKELSQLVRLTRSFPALVALKHTQRRLAEHKVGTTIEALLDLDLLTTAFVVIYTRLFDGGRGSGFGRDKLPSHLRTAHDEIIALRNKRFAHNDDHQSMSSMMQIESDEHRFYVRLELQLGYYVSGAKEWAELVTVLDAMYFDRLQDLKVRLEACTGREWAFPIGQAPE
jgi:hypothetical protein